MKAEERLREQEIERLCDSEVEKMWEKKVQQWKSEALTRQKLLQEVMESRRQQLQQKREFKFSILSKECFHPGMNDFINRPLT